LLGDKKERTLDEEEEEQEEEKQEQETLRKKKKDQAKNISHIEMNELLAFLQQLPDPHP
jgi:hypothetical protein